MTKDEIVRRCAEMPCDRDLVQGAMYSCEQIGDKHPDWCTPCEARKYLGLPTREQVGYDKR